ncbi:MAG TPA: hypothetical protein PK490_17920 [Prosthecobacter sp.]|nr:hypothetical protein [Prosthecobacter sp.]HRK16167.1 hypothetical protein [Prosthecobacter sp.]
MMKPTLFFLLALGVSSLSAREYRDLTNLDGVTIKAELLDLTDDGMLKVNVNLKPFQIPLASLSQADQDWLRLWDLERKQGKEAAYYSRVIFEDDFSGGAFKEGWGHYKSGSVIQDGVLVGITPEGSDHSAVDNIKFPGEQDLQVEVKFRFVSEAAKSFNVWFDDKDYKGAHAGHICQVTVSPAQVQMSDAKTGGFTLENGLYDRKKANQLTDEEKKMLESKTKRVPVKLELQKWHTLTARTKGDTIFVLIDGKEAGEFSSEGVAHATKSLVSLTTNAVDVHYDDFSVKAAAKPLSAARPAAR